MIFQKNKSKLELGMQTLLCNCEAVREKNCGPEHEGLAGFFTGINIFTLSFSPHYHLVPFTEYTEIATSLITETTFSHLTWRKKTA